MKELSIVDEERFWECVDCSGDCWLWNGTIRGNGYGGFYLSNKGGSMLAHRAAWLLVHGEPPAGLDLDHLCRVRRCVNPHHLEPVTRKENLLRGDGPRLAKERTLAKTHCKYGHAFTAENTKWKRGAKMCRICFRVADKIEQQRRRDRKKGKLAA